MFHLPAPFGLLGLHSQSQTFNQWLREMGIPNEKEYLDAYCRRTGIMEIENWAFYVAFSLFRMAGIAQGVYKRALQGNASAPNAMDFGPMVAFLADTACAVIDSYQTQPLQQTQGPSAVSHAETNTSSLFSSSFSSGGNNVVTTSLGSISATPASSTTGSSSSSSANVPRIPLPPHSPTYNIFTFSERTKQIKKQLLKFMEENSKLQVMLICFFFI